MNQQWRENWAASSLYHHLLNSKGQRMLAVGGLWLINTLPQSSQLISLADRKLLCGPGWTPVVPKGTILVFVPHSHSLPFSQVPVRLQKLWNVTRGQTICLSPCCTWFSPGDRDFALRFCAFCAWAARGIQRHRDADTHRRGSWVPSAAPTQELVPEDTSPAPATTFLLPELLSSVHSAPGLTPVSSEHTATIIRMMQHVTLHWDFPPQRDWAEVAQSFFINILSISWCKSWK